MPFYSDTPILINGSLAFVDKTTVPWTVRWEEDIFIGGNRNDSHFHNLIRIGSEYTDRFGVLSNYISLQQFKARKEYDSGSDRELETTASAS
jgi:hypothetical protein